MHFALSHSLAIRLRSFVRSAFILLLWFISSYIFVHVTDFLSFALQCVANMRLALRNKKKKVKTQTMNDMKLGCFSESHYLTVRLFVSSRKKKPLIKNSNNNNCNKRATPCIRWRRNQREHNCFFFSISILHIELDTKHWTRCNKSFQYAF